jgi:hypothetical protein
MWKQRIQEKFLIIILQYGDQHGYSADLEYVTTDQVAWEISAVWN